MTLAKGSKSSPLLLCFQKDTSISSSLNQQEPGKIGDAAMELDREDYENVESSERNMMWNPGTYQKGKMI